MSRTLLISQDRPIGQLAADDPRAAQLLFRKGIDPARNGRTTLAEACLRAQLDPAAVVQEIEAATAEPRPAGDDMQDWTLDRLVNHIVRTHHAYVRERVPILVNFLERLSDRHGREHPELYAMAILFKSVSADLLIHLDAEEQIIFPYIKPALLVAGLFRLIDSFKAFPMIYVLTNGGPGISSEVPAKYVYDYMFGGGNIGQGLAASTMMLLTVLIIMVPWAYLEFGGKGRR